MTKDDLSDQTEAAAQRFTTLFSSCSANEFGGGHTWSIDSRCCIRCGADFPYKPSTDGECDRGSHE